jgi:hypothetical protein
VELGFSVQREAKESFSDRGLGNIMNISKDRLECRVASLLLKMHFKYICF